MISVIQHGYDPKSPTCWPIDQITRDPAKIAWLERELAKLTPGGPGVLIEIHLASQMKYLKKWLKANAPALVGGHVNLRDISPTRVAVWSTAV
jgi:hypothetical protein